MTSMQAMLSIPEWGGGNLGHESTPQSERVGDRKETHERERMLTVS
jgi:hypothetical protein